MTAGRQLDTSTTTVVEEVQVGSTRERILETALDLFTERHFQHTSIADLSHAAGITDAEFRDEFATPYAVLKQIYDDITRDVVTNVLAALDDAPPGLIQHLYAGMGAYLHTMLDDPRRTLLAGVEVLGVDPALDTERRDARILFADFFAQLATTYQDQGVIPKGLTNLSYMALSAAIFEMAVTYASTPADLRPSFDAITTEAVHFFKSVVETPLY